MKRSIQIVSVLIFAFLLSACGSSLIIENVDFSQPLESVLSPDTDNVVVDQRYALRFDLTEVLNREGVLSVSEIRLLRDRAGFYYLTAPGFGSVYQFIPEVNSLKLLNRIEIPGTALQEPALNQRGTHIELVDTANGRTFNLKEI